MRFPHFMVFDRVPWYTTLHGCCRCCYVSLTGAAAHALFWPITSDRAPQLRREAGIESGRICAPIDSAKWAPFLSLAALCVWVVTRY